MEWFSVGSTFLMSETIHFARYQSIVNASTARPTHISAALATARTAPAPARNAETPALTVAPTTDRTPTAALAITRAPLSTITATTAMEDAMLTHLITVFIFSSIRSSFERLPMKLLALAIRTASEVYARWALSISSSAVSQMEMLSPLL